MFLYGKNTCNCNLCVILVKPPINFRIFILERNHIKCNNIIIWLITTLAIYNQNKSRKLLVISLILKLDYEIFLYKHIFNAFLKLGEKGLVEPCKDRAPHGKRSRYGVLSLNPISLPLNFSTLSLPHFLTHHDVTFSSFDHISVVVDRFEPSLRLCH